MMIGAYPCCAGNLALPTPDKTPAWRPEDCPHCGAKVWHRFSRIAPMSWTEPDFLAEHEIDYVRGLIIPKPGTEAEAFEHMQLGGE